MKPSSRRQVLGGVLATALAISLEPWRALVRSAPPPLAERLVRVVRDQVSAEVAGTAALAGAVTARTLSAVVDEIGATVPGGVPALEAASRGELADLVRQRVADDFAELRVVGVNGWIVADTEARVFALVALFRGDR